MSDHSTSTSTQPSPSTAEVVQTLPRSIHVRTVAELRAAIADLPGDLPLIHTGDHKSEGGHLERVNRQGLKVHVNTWCITGTALRDDQEQWGLRVCAFDHYEWESIIQGKWVDSPAPDSCDGVLSASITAQELFDNPLLTQPERPQSSHNFNDAETSRMNNDQLPSTTEAEAEYAKTLADVAANYSGNVDNLPTLAVLKTCIEDTIDGERMGFADFEAFYAWWDAVTAYDGQDDAEFAEQHKPLIAIAYHALIAEGTIS